jgi:hypothetical protein
MSDQAGLIRKAMAGPFRLERRARPARQLRYRCRDRYLTLGPGGEPVRCELHTADLTEQVDGAAGDAPAQLRWTFSQLACDLDADGPERETSLLETVLEVAGSAEDAGAYIPHLNSFGLPPTLRGWLAAEQVIHARLPEIVTSRRHGGIDSLRAVGDRVTMPWTGQEVAVGFAGFIDIRLRLGPSELRFDGLSVAGGQPVALLSFACRQDFLSIAGGHGTGHLSGQITLDLGTCDVRTAAWRQSNYLHTGIGSPQAAAVCQVVTGSTERIDDGVIT